MTILPLRYWLLVALVVFTSGCASTESIYTTRQCVIQIAQQVGENTFGAVLLCDQEKPYEAKK